MIDMKSVLPVQDANSKVWFDAVAEGKLLLQRDPATGKAQMYPRARVAGAPGREPVWIEASGRARLHTFTVVERSVHREFASLTPFVIAIVDLAEGARMTSWIVDVPADRLKCDMALKLVFREIYAGLKMPCFTEA